MSVQCACGKQGEPGNEAIYVHGLSLFSTSCLCLYTICECDKWAEYLSLASELQVGHTNYSWNVFIGILTTYWTAYFVLFHHIHYILKLHIKQKYYCASPLAYTHCKLKCEKSVNTRLLNTSPTLFCTGYLHIQMLIQTPHSDSPIIISNTVVATLH